VAAEAGPDKARFVRAMFDAIAGRYDLMNRLMTAGQDEAWRRLAADAVYPEIADVALDLGAGTGDLAFALVERAPRARVLALDFSEEMLRIADQKAVNHGPPRRVHPAQGDAQRLPVRDASVDAVLTAFTLRNVTDVGGVFAECARVLRPGGRLAVLELTPLRSHPVPGFTRAFRLYFHRVVPLLGRVVSGKGFAYEYLPASVNRFPDADALLEGLRAVGFVHARYRRLAFGTVALHVAQTPREAPSCWRGDTRPAGGTGADPIGGGETRSRAARSASMAALPHVEALPAVGAAPPEARSTPPEQQPVGLLVRQVVDGAEWNDLLSRLPNANALQTWEWGETRRFTGWVPRRLAFVRAGRTVAAASVARRQIPMTPFGVAYCAKGPALDYGDARLFGEVLRLLTVDTRRQRTVVLTVEPDAERASPGAVLALRESGYAPSPHMYQYPSTMLVDVAAGDDDLLSRMSSTWRRYVRKAARDGATVIEGAGSDLPRFYELYRETADRDRFIIRPLDYYQRTFDGMARSGLATLFLAVTAGRAEAGLVALRFGTRAWYVWGASSSIGQQARTPYLLQWHAMRWARDHGCDTYDMWGAPDDPEDETDPMYGVYYFKRGFGGRHVRWVGPYDYVASPALYALWNAGLPRVLGAMRALRGERIAAPEAQQAGT
jgi:ubiquinone/menaquinone biosynthesis methyltransferase